MLSYRSIQGNRFTTPFVLLAVLVVGNCAAAAERVAQYVIHISVDGGGANYIQHLVNEGQLANFKRFQTEGATTHNARTDFDYTITLPNHTCMVTGRPVMDKKFSDRAVAGHNWVDNGDPAPGQTLHTNAHTYVKSVFDMAHDNGLSTAMYASKTKFSLYDVSYNEANGAPDTSGDDNGRDKLDVAMVNENSLVLLSQFVIDMSKKPTNYNFVHFRDPDSAGHSKTWGSPEYIAALKAVDGYLGTIFQLVSSSSELSGKTTIILSADHGGFGPTHLNPADPLDYTIPFYVWGAGVAKGADLYELNESVRKDPGNRRIDYTAEGLMPIRNGDGGNLALKLLGIGAIPDSLINSAQDLVVDKPKK